MKLLDLIFAARPMLLLPLWTVYLISLHYHQEISERAITWRHLVVILTLSLAVAGACYLNQVFDIDTDRVNKKLGFIQRGMLSEKSLVIGYIVLSLLSVIVTALVAMPLLMIVLQIVFLAWAYSAPPLRLKDRAFWGIFANAYVFGFLVVLSIMPDLSVHTLGLLGWDNPFYFFCAVASITILTMITDREGDLAAGKRTVAVVLGARKSLILAFLLMALAAYVALRSNFPLLFYAATIAELMILAAVVLFSRPVVLLATRLPILMMTLLAGYFYPLYIVFLVALFFVTRVYYRRRFGIIYPSLAS